MGDHLSVLTSFPAEKYEASLLDRLADHCGDGWGEIEIHLHHGVGKPDTAENTRKQLADFRDILADRHNALCYWDGRGSPQYAFIHGSFALANSAGGLSCGVDSEMQVLAETGCYVDMTFPTGPFHRSQTAKINSLYECTTPLDRRESHRDGPDLRVGRAPRVFPLMVQGPLLWDFHPAQHIIGIENGALTTPNPPSIRRLAALEESGHHGRRTSGLALHQGPLSRHGSDTKSDDARRTNEAIPA